MSGKFWKRFVFPLKLEAMPRTSHFRFFLALLAMLSGALLATPAALAAGVFNVKDFGASGVRTDDARPALQRTIDACAASGGGTVLLPRGEYTSGTLHLRSRVRMEIAAGATLYATTNLTAYDYGTIPSKAALLYGENLEDVTITGEGTLDGQAQYEWRDDDVEHTFDHKDRMVAAGKSIRRSFPIGLPQRTVFPHLIFLHGCKGVQITKLRMLRSPSWTITMHACERTRLEGLYIYTSLEDAVWADGIDMDGCKDIAIDRCNIETGDDCIIFISTDVWGPARPCENITVSNCRLSSASAGIKFSEGNHAGVRNIVVRDCVLTNVNRGLVFYTVQGGDVSNVVMSNLTIHCNRFDWFWAGDGQPFHFRVLRLSEWNRQPLNPSEPKPGTFRDITLHNIVAYGKGSSLVSGHPESWLEGIRFDGVRLFLSADPKAPFDTATNAITFRHARNLTVQNLSVEWLRPSLSNWQSAVSFEQVVGLKLHGFVGRQARPDTDWPAVTLRHVTNAAITRATAPDDTGIFLSVDADSRGILAEGNTLRRARLPFRVDSNAPPNTVILRGNEVRQRTSGDEKLLR